MNTLKRIYLVVLFLNLPLFALQGMEHEKAEVKWVEVTQENFSKMETFFEQLKPVFITAFKEPTTAFIKEEHPEKSLEINAVVQRDWEQFIKRPGMYLTQGISEKVFFATIENKENEILKHVEDGLLITRFHYLNRFLNPRTALFTGTTRDGTFIIKDGKIKKPVKNLRFTQSMLEAFNNIVDLSEETEMFNDGGFFTCRVHSW